MFRRFTLWMVGVIALMMALGGAAKAAEDVIGDVKLSDSEEVAVLHTEKGDIVLQFYPDVAPKHVENFKKLMKEKFYDGIKFHRTMPGFMIQGGCPFTKQEGQETRWGTGDPGYKIKAEFNDKLHVRGTLSMARGPDPDSAGSQFFLCHAAAPFLNKKYTVFGQTVFGYNVIDKIVTAPTVQDGRENSRPKTPVAIKKAEIITWGDYKKSLPGK